MGENNEIYALCYCAHFAFKDMQNDLIENQRCSVFRDVLHVEWQSGNIFIFNYGVLVYWQLNAEDRKHFLDKIKPYAINPVTRLVEDLFTFEHSPGKQAVKNDHITLADHEIITKLALSHGIAQSIKLAQFEYAVQDAIEDTAYIPQRIASTGKTRLSRKDLAKLRGHLYLTKSDIMLNYDLLDTPEFFWDYPELDHCYQMMADYLEREQRMEVLSKKLETIHELLEMMADEQKHKHSSLLEWIIIWLIAFEIVVFLVYDIFKLL